MQGIKATNNGFKKILCHDWMMRKNCYENLTRSVGVICLSRYLQHLTLTGYKALKQPDYL